MSSFDINKALASLDRAQAKVGALCRGERWVMRVPVQKSDPDLVISEALQYLVSACDRVAELEAELQGATTIDSEESSVVYSWLASALGWAHTMNLELMEKYPVSNIYLDPLPRAASAIVTKLRELEAERDALRAIVAELVANDGAFRDLDQQDPGGALHHEDWGSIPDSSERTVYVTAGALRKAREIMR